LKSGFFVKAYGLFHFFEHLSLLKIAIRWLRIFMFLTLFLASACSRQTSTPPAASTPVPASSVPPPAAATPRPTLQEGSATAAASQTSSPSPSLTSTPTAALTPTLTPTPAPAVLIGAGDISYCSSQYLGDDQTAVVLAQLLQRYPEAAIFTAGDNVQGEGLDWEYRDCFNPTWGQFKARIHPVPGNHDFMTAAGANYYAYFGAAAGQAGQGWYSYDLGSWHIVALNSNCNDVSCVDGSAQVKWLQQDLADHSGSCTLLYWHNPRWSSGLAGSQPAVSAFWNAAVQYNAAIVINGDDHDYERFAPLDAAGKPDPAGVREFVAGTGGSPERAWGDQALPGSEVRSNDTWGVLVFKLYPGRYEWEFAPVAGGTFRDSGSGTCVK
jgi:acid phosphatase type 7